MILIGCEQLAYNNDSCWIYDTYWIYDTCWIYRCKARDVLGTEMSHGNPFSPDLDLSCSSCSDARNFMGVETARDMPY